jgi:hypothetical protein
MKNDGDMAVSEVTLNQPTASAPEWSALVVGQFEGLFPQGLKPRFIDLHLTYGLKPVPFKLTHYQCFRCADVRQANPNRQH